MQEYNHRDIEERWQSVWEKEKTYQTQEDSNKPKVYILDMFPYPSGAGLHVGHPKGYIATDVFSRMKRMQGYVVLHPMGWDAFGLPAENFAIKNKVHPRVAVDANIANYKEQLQHIGFDYDWSREIDTTDPQYYRWTQWIFLKLLERGLAYESYEPINWCPSCQTGLSNEDLEHGVCERCGSTVEQRPMRQWVLKITDYADRLLSDLDLLPEWQEHIKESQRNWIGRSEGAEIAFSIAGTDISIDVFTTRADTLFGVTYVVLAPEHPRIEELKSRITNWDEVIEYITATKKKTVMARQIDKEKTGIQLQGIMAVNPANNEHVPVWIADYVLGTYGTGAVMAVPAHDERDFEFAKKFGLPYREVIEKPEFWPNDKAYCESGIIKNSISWINGLLSEDATYEIVSELKYKKTAKEAIRYKLRDWVFSRQRYWGEPIPVIHCEQCGVVPVPEKDLPVQLPDVEHYEPTGTGESPLANITDWVNVSCPQCGDVGKRETNTMPQWAGSSWYYLRYMDPHNSDVLVAQEREQYWKPVDLYVGGAEHATRHLIYARFWHKFLFDIGIVSTPEPFTRLISVGLIQAEDGRKMSKRYGNVINPDDIVATYGADTLRVYEMFMGPFNDTIPWNTNNMIGARRFIERIWRLQERVTDSSSVTQEQELHKTIKKVGEDILEFKFNTAIAQMMIFVNVAEKEGITAEQYQTFLKVLAPFAPHMTEELWHILGNATSIHTAEWPTYDSSKLVISEVTVAVQVNGKVRGKLVIAPNTQESEVVEMAENNPTIKKWLENKKIQKTIYVPEKVVSFVTKEF